MRNDFIYLFTYLCIYLLFVCLFIVSYALRGEQIQGYTVAGGVTKARISYPGINLKVKQILSLL